MYVYSTATLTRHWKVLRRSLAGIRHVVCYAVKANSNLAILALFAQLGSGFDIVSAGELYRVVKAGAIRARSSSAASASATTRSRSRSSRACAC